MRNSRRAWWLDAANVPGGVKDIHALSQERQCVEEKIVDTEAFPLWALHRPDIPSHAMCTRAASALWGRRIWFDGP